VKRIVMTSSIVSVFDVASPSKPVYTETDWNEKNVTEIKEQGKDANALAKYSASKTMAERGTMLGVSMRTLDGTLMFRRE
jgi:hypothetical protein